MTAFTALVAFCLYTVIVTNTCIVPTFASSKSFQLEYRMLAFHFPLCNNSKHGIFPWEPLASSQNMAYFSH